jgi:hypothetical protein
VHKAFENVFDKTFSQKVFCATGAISSAYPVSLEGYWIDGTGIRFDRLGFYN